jgi:predicted alpha/beta-hydrolase family hydrolase
MQLLIDGDDDAASTFLMAHGAGAAMDSAGMNALVGPLVSRGIRVVRFEFGYMAGRRDGVRKPPPRADTLLDEYRAVLTEVGGRPVIGGRSMGGRVASMVADDAAVSGLVCVSYPWHPPAKPDQPRIAHLEHLATPTLIVQGTRDPFGSPAEVAGYPLSPAIELLWLEDGDHDLTPRKSVSGFTAAQHLDTAAEAVAAFVRRVAG